MSTQLNTLQGICFVGETSLLRAFIKHMPTHTFILNDNIILH